MARQEKRRYKMLVQIPLVGGNCGTEERDADACESDLGNHTCADKFDASTFTSGSTFANAHAELYESRNWDGLNRVNFYILVTFLVLCLDIYVTKLYGSHSTPRACYAIRP